MPSEKVLKEKQALVKEISDTLKAATAGVLVDYKGINVEDDTKLRKELREAGVEYTVIKNRLLRYAIKEVGFDALDDVLVGSTALAISNEDPVTPAKIIGKYADQSGDFFNIKAGFVDGEVIDADRVKALGKLPGKEQLLTNLLFGLTGNIRGLAIALNAVAEQMGGEEAAPAEEPKAEEAPAEVAAEEVKPEAEETKEEAPTEEAKAEDAEKLSN